MIKTVIKVNYYKYLKLLMMLFVQTIKEFLKKSKFMRILYERKAFILSSPISSPLNRLKPIDNTFLQTAPIELFICSILGLIYFS
jgi:hypothetical protein